MRHDVIQEDLFMKLAHHGKVSVTNVGLGGMVDDDGRKRDLLFPYLDPIIARWWWTSVLRAAVLSVTSTMRARRRDMPCITWNQPNSPNVSNPYRRVGVYFNSIGAEMHGVISKN
mmetsp:Transcript_11325/g.18440  ORF Transcript_11325/g.18440 Transcript_11325/m.18440 type:complete len:115 (+) Transcript_11325:154-498(+)